MVRCQASTGATLFTAGAFWLYFDGSFAARSVSTTSRLSESVVL